MGPHWVIPHWAQLVFYGLIAVGLILAFGNFKQ